MKILLPFLLLLTILSCNKKTVSPYQGGWFGVYIGAGDHGNISFAINDDGNASGVAESFPLSQKFQLTGSVTSVGYLTLHFGSSATGGVFTGTMNSISVSGAWVNNSNPTSGNWSASKQ